MSDLMTLNAGAVVEAEVGEPLAWSKRTRSAFETFGLPRELARKQATQPRPRTVVRSATQSLIRSLEEAKEVTTTVPRRMLVGDPGCGKSTYLLQAVAHALESKWVVLYVPRAVDWINSSSPYLYSSQLGTYLQPELAQAMMQSLLKVNGSLLSHVKGAALRLSESHVWEDQTPLDKVLKEALQESVPPHIRQLALEHVVRTLAKQTQVPFLVAVDDVQALFSTSEYRDPDFAPLQAYELALPRALLNLCVAPAPGEGVQRGAVLTAMSTSHASFPPSAELLTALREATSSTDGSVPWDRLMHMVHCRRAATRVQEPNAYTPLQDTHLAHAQAAQFAVTDVSSPLDQKEAASILQLLHRERAIWTSTCLSTMANLSVPNDEVFMAKLVESNGNMKVFERSLRTSLM